MEAAIVLIVFIALVIIGVPIGWSIAGVSLGRLLLYFADENDQRRKLVYLPVYSLLYSSCQSDEPRRHYKAHFPFL